MRTTDGSGRFSGERRERGTAYEERANQDSLRNHMHYEHRDHRTDRPDPGRSSHSRRSRDSRRNAEDTCEAYRSHTRAYERLADDAGKSEHQLKASRYDVQSSRHRQRFAEKSCYAFEEDIYDDKSSSRCASRLQPLERFVDSSNRYSQHDLMLCDRHEGSTTVRDRSHAAHMEIRHSEVARSYSDRQTSEQSRTLSQHYYREHVRDRSPLRQETSLRRGVNERYHYDDYRDNSSQGDKAIDHSNRRLSCSHTSRHYRQQDTKEINDTRASHRSNSKRRPSDSGLESESERKSKSSQESRDRRRRARDSRSRTLLKPELTSLKITDSDGKAHGISAAELDSFGNVRHCRSECRLQCCCTDFDIEAGTKSTVSSHAGGNRTQTESPHRRKTKTTKANPMDQMSQGSCADWSDRLLNMKVADQLPTNDVEPILADAAAFGTADQSATCRVCIANQWPCTQPSIFIDPLTHQLTSSFVSWTDGSRPVQDFHTLKPQWNTSGMAVQQPVVGDANVKAVLIPAANLTRVPLMSVPIRTTPADADLRRTASEVSSMTATRDAAYVLQPAGQYMVDDAYGDSPLLDEPMYLPLPPAAVATSSTNLVAPHSDSSLESAKRHSVDCEDLMQSLGGVELKKLLDVVTSAKTSLEQTLPQGCHGESSDNKEEKLALVERAADEVKAALKPFFLRDEIDKEEYKDIMRRAVPKIASSKAGIDTKRVREFVGSYVAKVKTAQKRVMAARQHLEQQQTDGDDVSCTAVVTV